MDMCGRDVHGPAGWYMPMKGVPDPTGTFRFETGEASAPSVVDIVERWNYEGAC